MTKLVPIIAAIAPAKVDLEAGKDYFWCQCGKSKSQPFCDGSHAGSDITPLKFTAEKKGQQHCANARPAPMRRFVMGHMRALSEQTRLRRAALSRSFAE
jgi:CDGSH-type Zn-finger protein